MSLIGSSWSGWAGQIMGWELRAATMQDSIMNPNLETTVMAGSSFLGSITTGTPGGKEGSSEEL